MEILGDLIKILLPAAIVLYAMYLTVKAFLNKDFEKKLVEIKLKNTEQILPLRLQAYERMCLFLERITPQNLVVRVNNPNYNNYSFQQQLIAEIREEFNHNLSQQLYMSDQAWALVKNAMDEIIALINITAKELPPDGKSIELAKGILDNYLKNNQYPTENALKYLKNEIRQVF